MARSTPPPPAWVVALANAADDEKALSSTEAAALEEGFAELRRKNVRILSQSDIEQISVMASSNYSGHGAQDGAQGFYCGEPDSAHPCVVSEEFQERLRSLGSEIPTHYKYTYNGSIPPVVLTHSTDPLFKVTLGLAMMCGVIAGFMVGYLLVL